jgi:hypothetical protein
MRSIIKRCQDKAAQLKSERRKKELANGSAFHPSNEVLYTPIAADQSISGNDTSFHSQITNDSHSSHLPASNLENGNCFPSPGFAQMNSSSVSHSSHAMPNNSQMQPQQQQQYTQQHHQQLSHQQSQPNYPSNMMQPNVAPMVSQNTLKQMHQQAPKSSNAMLMTMLSDVPAANSQQFVTYGYQGQNASYQQTGGQMNAMAVASGKVKKPRKRKGTNGSTGFSRVGPDAGIKGGGNLNCSPSPKRKVSEDDFGRDLAGIPNTTEPMDTSVGFDTFAGSGGQLSRPPSTASSSNYFLIT